MRKESQQIQVLRIIKIIMITRKIQNNNNIIILIYITLIQITKNYCDYYKFMKQNLSLMDRRSAIIEIINELHLEEEKSNQKLQIVNCLQFASSNGECQHFVWKLADWFLTNYIDIKSNTQMFLQYGNLKHLSKQSRDILESIFKKCEEKFGENLNQQDIYHSMLMKNPYMGFQMGYMYPPYGMSSSYPGIGGLSLENYDKMYPPFDVQQYYMQMSKYGYPVNQFFMPPMHPPMGVKYPGAPQTAEKQMYYPYHQTQVMPQPNNQMIKPKTAIPQGTIVNSKLRSSEYKPGNNEKQVQENINIVKKKQRNSNKSNPFIITAPHEQKTLRQEIPEKIDYNILHEETEKSHNKNTNGNVSMVENEQNIGVAIVSNIRDEANEESSQIVILQKPAEENISSKKDRIEKPQRVKKNHIQYTNFWGKIQDDKNKKAIEAVPKPVVKIGTEFQEMFKYCQCKGMGVSIQVFHCKNCQRKFHYACIEKKINHQQKEQECCHFCFLKQIDPLHEVVHEIKINYVADIMKCKFSEYCDFQFCDSHITQGGDVYQLQLRSMRLEDASNMNPEYTWPDDCIIMINDDKAIQFQALQHNSSLKKRKDMSVILTPYIYTYPRNYSSRKHMPIGFQIKQNSLLEMSQKKIKNNYVFFFGIYLIKKKTPEELTQEIYSQSNNKVNFAEKFFSQPNLEDDIEIEQFKVALTDPFTWNLIDIPVRGRKCIHGQCFDLKTFLTFMNVQKVRQWKCPICTKQCRSFYIDIKQLEVLKQFKKHSEDETGKKLSKQVEFHRDGKTLFAIQNQQEEAEQDRNNNSFETKTKIISKHGKEQKQIQ